MMIHDTPLFRIYWGDARDKIYPSLYKGGIAQPLSEHPSFASVYKRLPITELMFLEQTHSNKGMVLSENSVLEPFVPQGDYLITDKPAVGIGVMTGDCLPIAICDSRTPAIAIVHAGWRGSVQNIVARVVKDMQQAYGTKKEDLKFFFGPSAQVCCYQVSEDFKNHLDACTAIDEVLIRRGDDLYFDLPHYNWLQLQNLGIKREALNETYNLCTMCDHSFFSARRASHEPDPARAGMLNGRQMTIVALK